MNEINIAVEELAVQKKSKLSYSMGKKVAAIPDASAGRYSYNNWVLNHKVLSDEEMVRSFVETHDKEAFNEIVNRYANKIYRLALRITHDRSDAEDARQKVFVTLIEKLSAFRGDSRFSTWLYGVALNACYWHLRVEKKYKRAVSLEDYFAHDEDGTLKEVQIKDWRNNPDEALSSKETMEAIERATKELPASYRTVFHLRDVEGLSNEEAAEILGVSLPNVKSRIHRARLYLRDKLSDYFYE